MSAGVAVGVVGEAVDDIVAAIEAEGGRPQVGGAESVLAADLDAIVTVGESATLDVARRRPTVPLLPIDAGRGLRSVSAELATDAAPSITTGDWHTETHPLVRIDHAGETAGHALTDVTLVTSEAARISEFAVSADGDHVGQFRADGVVVATPAGTPGYAHRLGTPITAAETGVVAVAPIAPFATNPDDWLVPDDHLEITVERDEAAVTLFADDRSAGEVAFDDPVTLTTDRSVDIGILPESQPRFP